VTRNFCLTAVFASGCVIGPLGIAGTSAANSGWEFVLEFGNGPGDMAVDSSHNVYDLHDNRVQVFTPEGMYLREWTVLANSRSIAIDENDVVYVLSRCRVVGYTTDGDPVLGWDSCIGQGDLQQGFGIDVRAGLVYIGTASDLLKFATDGTLLDVFEDGGNWRSVKVLADGSVWVVNSDTGYGLVRHFSGDGEVLAEWTTILPGEEGSYPRGLDLDTLGRIFVVDEGARVKIFLSDGTLDDLIQWQLRIFANLDLDGDDVLYVGADFPAGVMKFHHKVTPVEPSTWGSIKSRFRCCRLPALRFSFRLADGRMRQATSAVVK